MIFNAKGATPGQGPSNLPSPAQRAGFAGEFRLGGPTARSFAERSSRCITQKTNGRAVAVRSFAFSVPEARHNLCRWRKPPERGQPRIQGPQGRHTEDCVDPAGLGIHYNSRPVVYTTGKGFSDPSGLKLATSKRRRLGLEFTERPALVGQRKYNTTYPGRRPRSQNSRGLALGCRALSFQGSQTS